MVRRLVVEADGGSRGNPGPAGFGALVRDAHTGQVLAEVAESIGSATNNVAEYGGLVAGLRAAAAVDPDAAVEVRMDSKLVVEQMSGRWQIKHEDMRRLADEARRALPPGQVRYTWVPREQNAAADRLANAAMDAAARGGTWTPGPALARHRDEQEDPLTPTTSIAPTPVPGYAGDVTPPQAWATLSENPAAVLVDVRTRAEWGYVGVPDLSGVGKQVVLVEWQTYPNGARNPAFVDDLRAAGVADNAPLVFLCRSGVRSVAAAQAATAAGLGPSFNVLDGFEGQIDAAGHRGGTGWRTAGLPWRQS